MNVSKVKITTLFFLFSLAGLFLTLWIVDYSSVGLPETLPIVEWRTYGFLILAMFMLVIWLFQKQVLKSDSRVSALELILLSTLIIFSSLLIYQFIRQNIILNWPFSMQLLSSAAIPSAILILLAASTALSLKKANNLIKRIPLFLLIVIMILSKKYVHSFEW